MSRRWLLGLVGVVLVGCAAPSAPPRPATTSATPPTTSATLSFAARIDWALAMCTTTFAVGQVAGPMSQFDVLGQKPDFANALHDIQSAQQTVDAIAPTGVADLDDLTRQLRQAVDGAAPRISTLLNAGINGHPDGVVDQVTQLVVGIHPDDNELFEAGQDKPDVGDALHTAASCPTEAIP